jgi:LacI family transcriptional regulator
MPAAPDNTGQSMTKRDPTIVDVAREAGVSIRTVSRVLNGGHYVSEQKRIAVLEIIQRLQFVPSAGARALPGRRSYTLGLVFEKLSANYMIDIQLAVVDLCHRYGHRLIVEQFTPEILASPQLTGAAVSNLRIDGAIVLPPTSDNAVLLDAIEAAGVRYTRIAPTVALERSSAVVMNEGNATRAMVAHLAGLGHRRIGFVIGNHAHASSHRRLEAFWAATRDHGIDPQDISLCQGDYRYESGLAAGKALLSQPTPPTAIFASNDAMAAGVIAAAGMLGFLTPSQLSVCGFDDSPLSRHIWPPLTTIRQPLTEMAQSAALQLLDPASCPRLIPFDFTLVIRASTAEPALR